MRRATVRLALAALLFGACRTTETLGQGTRVLVDSTRARSIPVVIYTPTAPGKCSGETRCPVALLSAGHGMKNVQYAFLASALTRLGYLVIGIQHEQPGDPPLPFSGNMMVLRMPFWKTGVGNLQFVRAALRQEYPHYDWDHLTLVGHSNGGDVSALFAEQHPEQVTALVTLDNRRYPLPRTSNPRVLSIRAGSDIAADPGVLPDTADQATYGIRIVTIGDAKHEQLTALGPLATQARVVAIVTDFLASPATRP